ncbi:hypothetical protein [Loktanella sp. Alg231-35]|uniref:hypothetical protein n=1 Tax=Loktanella sp. Alg231-35 TaxID=1922220 RepID=UPI000D550CBB|nr:hypothetical protein [Loktanella sp. Alg231-35]
MFGTCSETVSVLYAVIFGAGDACVRLDLWSLGSAFAAFIVLVVIAQFAARKLWSRIAQPPFDHDVAEHQQPLGRGDPENPIKSSRF